MSTDEITRLLNDFGQSDRSVEDRLFPLLYPELRRIAASLMRRERPDHTLQATGLVHEVYLRIAGNEHSWKNRSHFFAIASRIMRKVLVDHARKYKALKRGGGVPSAQLEDCLVTNDRDADLVAEVDLAIERLSALDPRQAEIVLLRFFGGLTEQEIAEGMGISVRTVKRDWYMARGWLRDAFTVERGSYDA